MSAVAKRGPLLIGAGFVSVLMLVGPPAAAQPVEPVQPTDFGQPTREQIAASIHVWDPTGHVKVIETETTEGDEAVLSLDSDILFAFGSAELSSKAVSTIAELVADIPQGVGVSITGHTDDIGSDAENLMLSQRRGESVAAAVTAGRADLRLDVEGRGENDSVESNSSPEGQEANRRVEIRYGS